MIQNAWQRRSSNLNKVGSRFSQDPSKSAASRLAERNSKIPLPRSTSQACLGALEPGQLVRSKSTLGPYYTPQEKNKLCTPQSQISIPLYASVSSNKKGNVQKDLRNLQDREYQQKALSNVVGFFRNKYNSNFKVGDIRPPTIKMFSDLMNVLFEQLGLYNIDALIQFNPSNYEKDVPHWMKGLQYPINTNKSWLKTVNVPQCFPHVIGMLSWLVSLVQLTEMYDLETRLNEFTDKDSFYVVYFNACLAAANRPSDNRLGDIDDIIMHVIRFSEKLDGVTDDVIIALKSEIEEHRESIAKDSALQAEVEIRDEILQRCTVARAQSLKATEVIENKLFAIEEIKSNLSKKERNIISIKAEVEKMQRENELLQNRVKSQTMSHTEFIEFDKKSKYLLKEIEYSEKECEDNENIISRYEHDIAIKRDKILQQASTFNRHVIQLEQHVPDLKGHRARTNPESTDVKEEVEKLVEALRKIKSGFVTELTNLEVYRSERQISIDHLKQRLQEVLTLDHDIRDQVHAKKNQIEHLKIDILQKEKSFQQDLEDFDKDLKIRQKRQVENDKKREQADALDKRMCLVSKGKEKVQELTDQMWHQFEEKAQLVKSQLVSLKQHVQSQEIEVESWIEEIVAKKRQN